MIHQFVNPFLGNPYSCKLGLKHRIQFSTNPSHDNTLLAATNARAEIVGLSSSFSVALNNDFFTNISEYISGKHSQKCL